MAEWKKFGGGQFPELPEELIKIQESIQPVASFLIDIMDIAKTALDLLKAFSVGQIDPYLPIIDALLQEVEQILFEFLRAGFYFTGDWFLTSWPFDDLLGGFDSFEARAIGRLTDRTDPTRPDFTANTAVFAVFFYASAEFDNVSILANFMKSLVDFFRISFDFQATVPTPFGLQVQYGQEGQTPSLARNILETFVKIPSGSVDTAKVSWRVSKPSKNPRIPFPGPPPFGFRVTVSTIEGGIPVFFDQPTPFTKKIAAGVSGEKVQARESSQVVDENGAALFLYGGADDIANAEEWKYNESFDSSGNIKDGERRVYARKNVVDDIPIPLNLFKTDDGKHLFQKAFYLRSEDVIGPFGRISPSYLANVRYSLELRWPELPYTANLLLQPDGTVEIEPDSVERPDTFYVYVRAVDNRIRDANDFRYEFNTAASGVIGTPFFATLANSAEGKSVTLNNASPVSFPIQITFPNEETRSVLDMLTAALAVLGLSRSDLPVEETGKFAAGKAATPTGLESFGDLVAEIVSARNPNSYFEIDDQDNEKGDMFIFRKSFLEGCQRVAAKLYENMGTNNVVQNHILQNCEILLTWRWLDTELEFEAQTATGTEIVSSDTYNFPNETILESLQPGLSAFRGVARNPFAAAVLHETSPPYRRVLGRTPGFFEKDNGTGSADYSPCIKVTRVRLSQKVTYGTRLIYARNLFPDEVYQAARIALGISTPPLKKPVEDGNWQTIRFDKAFPEVEQFVRMILNFADTLRDGVKDVTSAISDYIDFVESRLVELEDLLFRIDTTLTLATIIKFPQFAMLTTVSNGTDGLVSDFLQATDKPVDGEEFYGAGGVVVAGGLPTFLISLISEFLSGP